MPALQWSGGPTIKVAKTRRFQLVGGCGDERRHECGGNAVVDQSLGLWAMGGAEEKHPGGQDRPVGGSEIWDR